MMQSDSLTKRNDIGFGLGQWFVAIVIPSMLGKTCHQSDVSIRVTGPGGSRRR